MKPGYLKQQFFNLYSLLCSHLVNKLLGVRLIDHGGNIGILFDIGKELDPVAEGVSSPTFE